MKTKKDSPLILIIPAVLFLIISIIIIIAAIFNINKTATIKIVVAPKSAVVTLNNKEYNNGTYKLEPGTYDIEVKKDGFETYSEKITLEDNQTYELLKYLVQNDGTFNWYLENHEDLMLLNTIGDLQAEKESKKYIDSDPIFSITPYDNYNDGFKINASKNKEGKTELQIYLYSCRESEQAILKTKIDEWLKKNNININNYLVSYSSC